jgi:hypothetical protein
LEEFSLNNRGQFSIIAALFVAVILVSSVVITYSTIRYNTNQDAPQILSAVDETNLALKQVLGFTVGYYGSILQVTGNSSYAYGLSSNYLNSGLANIADIRPEWGTSFAVNSLVLGTNWFMNESFSKGELKISYSLAGLGISGVSYTASCRLDVQVVPSSGNQVSVNVVKDEATPLTDLGLKSFKFYLYAGTNLTWVTVNPPNEPTSFTNGTYLIDIPQGINPRSYTIQVQDERGITVAASSFSHLTGTLTFNNTYGEGGDYVDNYGVSVGGSSDVGFHTNFPAQQIGPDGGYDTLNEAAYGTASQPSYPLFWNPAGSTTCSGTVNDLQTNNGVYMSLHSYGSDFSGSAIFGYQTKGGSTTNVNNIKGSRFTVNQAGMASSISSYLRFTAQSGTFGNSNTGSSGDSIINSIRGEQFTSPATPVSVQSIDAYISCTSAAKNMKAAIYDNSGNLVGTSSEVSVPTGANWRTFNFATKPTLTELTNYVLVLWSQSGSGAADLRYSSGSGGNGRYVGSQSYGSWPATLSFQTNANQYSIRCNYNTGFKAKAAVYSSTGGNLIGTTEEKIIGTVDNWVTFNFVTQPLLSASTDYVLAVWSSDTSNVVIYRDSGSAQRFEGSGTYPNWPATINDQGGQRTYSIYCTYSPASQYKVGAEFTGQSSAPPVWNDLVWAIDSSISAGTVTATFQVYNWVSGQYPTSGNGFATPTLGTTDLMSSQTIASNPTNFLNSSGYWKINVTATKTTPFDLKLDLVKYSPDVPVYGLNLTEQWVNLNSTYLNPHPILCINTGVSIPAGLALEAWTGSRWQTISNSMVSGWNNFSISSYLTIPDFIIRLRAESGIVQKSWVIDAALIRPESDQQLFKSLQDPSATVTVELLQNGSMLWLGQNLTLTNADLQVTNNTIPIPPIPVKALHVNETVEISDNVFRNEEVPFQVEDWASGYTIPLGMTNNATVFGNRQMIVFLVNTRVSEFTIWWNGSDEAVQTPLAFVNTDFQNDDPNNGVLSNNVLNLKAEIVNDPIDQANVFRVTSTVGSSVSVAKFMRINGQNSTYGSSQAFVIYHGVVRDVIQQEAEWNNGAPGCPNIYANIVLTLPAHATYFTYQLGLTFISSSQARAINDLVPIKVSTTTTPDLVQTENGTTLNDPIVSSVSGPFYNYFPFINFTSHHWSQFTWSAGSQGTGIMFTNATNQRLYAFDSGAAVTGSLNVNSTVARNTIEFSPVTRGLGQVSSFPNPTTLSWSGAIVTFAGGATPIFDGVTGSGMWVLAELPPMVAVRTEN